MQDRFQVMAIVLWVTLLALLLWSIEKGRKFNLNEKALGEAMRSLFASNKVIPILRILLMFLAAIFLLRSGDSDGTRILAMSMLIWPFFEYWLKKIAGVTGVKIVYIRTTLVLLSAASLFGADQHLSYTEESFAKYLAFALVGLSALNLWLSAKGATKD